MLPPIPLIHTKLSHTHLSLFSPSPTSDDQIKWGTHRHPLQEQPPKRGRKTERLVIKSHTDTSGNTWNNLHLVPRFSTTWYYPSCVARNIYPHIQYYSSTHKTEYRWRDLFINTPLHKLYSTILKRFWIDKTWWWPLPAETCSFILNRI